MAKSAPAAFVLVAAALCGTASSESFLAAKNPIRKVVTLLQDMQKKVEQEGKKAEELYKKFECYCTRSDEALAKSIEEAEAATAEMGPAIEAAAAKKEGLEKEVKQQQEEREATKKAIAEATALREKEKAAHDEFRAEASANFVALGKAIESIERGMAGGFLQTGSAVVLRRFVKAAADLPDSDRQALLAFLSGQDATGYAPASGEISGILKELRSEMDQGRTEAIATEEAAAKAHAELTAAKKKELAALSASIEEKLGRVGEIGVKIAAMQGELGDAGESLSADKGFLANLDKSCAAKKKTHEEEMANRADEIVAIAETIKVLNDDDALTLFKRTLSKPAASFVQVQTTSGALRAEASAVLSDLRGRLPGAQSRAGVDFIALALRGKKVGFEKVVKLIDDLVASLKTEQADDDGKKEYCSVQFNEADDRKKGFERELSDLETEMAASKEAAARLVEEIAALKEGIASLDKSVAEATEQRKAEHAEYKSLMANNGAAKELIIFAKNRLNKYYNPKLHKAPAKAELSREDRVFVNQGGKLPTTTAPAGIGGSGVTLPPAFLQLAGRRGADAPPPPPETMEAYSKKTEESNGVMALLDLLVKDLDKEMTVAESEEKDAQADYERTLSDAAEKRAADSKGLSDRQGSKADVDAFLEGLRDAHDSASKEHMANDKFISSLHAECDWLVKYFDVRKEARSDEMDSLKRAKEVLAGADYSLVQRSSAARTRTFLRH